MQIREMQSKIIKRYHFSPVRMAIIPKTKDKQWQRCEEQKYVGTLCGMQTALVTMESIMEVPQNIKKIKPLLNPAILLLLGIYPKEIKTEFQRDICIPVFTKALPTIAKI